MTLENLTDATPKGLPPDYVSYLSTARGSAAIRDDGGALWTIPDLAGVQRCIDVDEYSGPYWQQLALHIDSIGEFFEEQSFEQLGRGRPSVSFDRLREVVVVADDGESLLYLDPADGFAAYKFHHDGTYVERCAESFNEWLLRLKRTSANS